MKDMFPKIEMYNGKTQLTGAALKKFNFNTLPIKGLDQIHMKELTGQSDQEMINFVSKGGRTAETWDQARNTVPIIFPNTLPTREGR